MFLSCTPTVLNFSRKLHPTGIENSFQGGLGTAAVVKIRKDFNWPTTWLRLGKSFFFLLRRYLTAVLVVPSRFMLMNKRKYPSVLGVAGKVADLEKS